MIRELKQLNDPLWPALVALYEASFDRASREPISRLESEIRREFRLPFRFFVDEEEGRFRGFARWCILRTLPSSFLDDEGRAGWGAAGTAEREDNLSTFGFLIHLAVDPKSQGGGIGKSLMRKLLDLCPSMIFEADPKDERLMRFYARFGARTLTPTYTQPALHSDTEAVPYSLIGIGPFPDVKATIEAFYRYVWELPSDHPCVLRALEGAR